MDHTPPVSDATPSSVSSEPNEQENLTNKTKKKTLVLVVSVILAVLLIGGGATAAAVYWYFNSDRTQDEDSDQTDSADQEDGQTEDDSQGDEDAEDGDNESDEDDNTSEFTCEILSPDIEIEYLDDPVSVDQFEVFTDEMLDDSYLNEDNYQFMKTGTVTDGQSPTGNDLSGYDSIVMTGNNEENVYVKLFADTSRTQIYVYHYNFNSMMGGLYESFLPTVVLIDFGSENAITAERVDFMNRIKPFIADGYMSTYIYQSDNGNYYNYASFVASTIEDIDTNGGPVDTICGYDIYLSDDGKNYIESDDGYAYKMIIFPEFYQTTLPEGTYQRYPEVTWTEGESSVQAYDYISVGGCSVVQTLELGDFTLSDLRTVGTTETGDSIYMPIDANETYQKKVYEEDYTTSDNWQYNTITADDNAPLDYGTYLSYHPVFYWQDPFGRFIRFVSQEFVMTGGCAKPAIYLYPEETTDIQVQVIPNGELRFTYPRYPSDGWFVRAHPSGEIYNYTDGKTYDYLWWDSVAWNVAMPDDGFVVHKSALSSFFEKTLSEFGLNEKEIADFSEYWVKRMEQENTDYFVVSYLFNSQVDQIAQLQFDSQPDTVMRVFMFYTPIESPIEIEAQHIPHITRDGFTVTEWGGAKRD